MTLEDDDKPFKTTCKQYIGFLIFSGKIGELLYIIFIHAGVYNIGLYPKDIVPENFHCHWPGRTKTKRIYQRLLKEVNANHRYLRCTDLRNKNFEVSFPVITLDKVDLVCT